MKTKPPAPQPAKTQRANSLHEVLGKSERVKVIVEQCAEDLAAVNLDLKNEPGVTKDSPGVESALKKSEAVEEQVQIAADELSSVNQALKQEVHTRHDLEDQLHTATQKEAMAVHASLHDRLTGLPNRTLFDDRLTQALAHARRHEISFAVMFMDLDGFKNINDSHGHDVGDIVLQTVARRLRESVREDDTVCRLGGDEFLYLLMEIQNEPDVTAIAKKLIKSIQLPCDIDANGKSLELSICPSIGIAVFPQDGETGEALLVKADEAMYRAKRDKTGHAFASDLTAGAA